MRFLVAWVLLFTSCAHHTLAKQEPLIFSSAEAAADYVRKQDGQSFDVFLANEHTLEGSPDDHNLGWVIIGEAALARGYKPERYEKRVGYGTCHFKRSQ